MSLARIQHAARYGQVIPTNHAQDEMDDARAQMRDVEHAILTATTATEQEAGKFRLEGGTSLDGEGLIVVVIEIQLGLSVITVF